MDYLAILAIVAVLSFVQSLFGMGVLIFGTPTLILLGHGFLETLCILVPASFIISVLQVIASRKEGTRISLHLYWCCFPGIALGFWLIQGGDFGSWLNYLIAVVLLFSGLLRIRGGSSEWLSIALKRHSLIYHFIMGFVHGLTNLGGALLAILASSYHSEKVAIRYTVAYYYMAFGAIQLVLIGGVFGEWELLLANLPIAAVAGAIYLLFGNKAFHRTDGPMYHHAFTAFIIIYGITIVFVS